MNGFGPSLPENLDISKSKTFEDRPHHDTVDTVDMDDDMEDMEDMDDDMEDMDDMELMLSSGASESSSSVRCSRLPSVSAPSRGAVACGVSRLACILRLISHSIIFSSA